MVSTMCRAILCIPSFGKNLRKTPLGGSGPPTSIWKSKYCGPGCSAAALLFDGRFGARRAANRRNMQGRSIYSGFLSFGAAIIANSVDITNVLTAKSTASPGACRPSLVAQPARDACQAGATEEILCRRIIRAGHSRRTRCQRVAPRLSLSNGSRDARECRPTSLWSRRAESVSAA